MLDQTEIKNALLNKMADFWSLWNKGFFEKLKTQPYRLRALLEMYFAKFLLESKSEKSTGSENNFGLLLDLIVKYVLTASAQLKTEQYPV